MILQDRRDAGRRLAAHLTRFSSEQPVVLGLPRGGVPVAYEVAHELRAPLDVLVVRKVGAPHNPEYGIGAVSEEDVLQINRDAVNSLRISDEALESAIQREREELERRLKRYRGGRPAVSIRGRTVVIVDDGLATGVSATAAAHAARERGAGHLVLAVPVAAPDSLTRVGKEYDETVCLHAPRSFLAVGSWYKDFSQTTDDTVVHLLSLAHDELPTGIGDSARPSQREVEVDAGALTLPGDLTQVESTRGLVVFAHGSGSSRRSPRNRHVAEVLNQRGFSTLLFDLLTPQEEHDRGNVFNIALLADRLVQATRWAQRQDFLAETPIGFFGASTGAAAALVAAAELGRDAGAVVSRGGRPDLALERLHEVTAPTLLIVGGRDGAVLEMNEEAARALRAEHELVVVPGAGHLFEEPGALDAVAGHAGEWFARHLGAGAGQAAP